MKNKKLDLLKWICIFFSRTARKLERLEPPNETKYSMKTMIFKNYLLLPIFQNAQPENPKQNSKIFV